VNNKVSMKSIIVARVSTEEQREAGNSLPAQEQRITEYCMRKGFDVMQTYSFDESAYKTKRDEFDKILDDVARSKEKIAVCFDKVDRLSRNIFDKRVALLYEKAVADEIELHFVSDGQVIDRNMNAGDKFAFGMKLGLSKYYSDAISDNVKRAFEQKRRNGEITGPCPIGYVSVALDAKKRTRKDLIIDPIKGHLIKKMFELYATGEYSHATLRDEITKRGLKATNDGVLSRSMIGSILKNTFYYGIYKSKEHGTYSHRYPRLITKELYEQCADIRLKRFRTPVKSRSKDYLLSKMFTCEKCGCAVTGKTTINRHGQKYIHYSCTNGKGICKREYVEEHVFLDIVHELLDTLGNISYETQQELLEEIRKNTEAEIAYHKAQVQRVHAEYEKIKKQDNRLLDALISDSITKDIYDKKHEQLQDQLQRLQIELEEHTSGDYEYQTTVAKLIDVSRRAREIFEKCSQVSEKRAFLNMLLANPTLNGKKPSITLASPFDTIITLVDCPDLLPVLDEFRTLDWGRIALQIEKEPLFQSPSVLFSTA